MQFLTIQRILGILLGLFSLSLLPPIAVSLFYVVYLYLCAVVLTVIFTNSSKYVHKSRSFGETDVDKFTTCTLHTRSR